MIKKRIISLLLAMLLALSAAPAALAEEDVLHPVFDGE